MQTQGSSKREVDPSDQKGSGKEGEALTTVSTSQVASVSRTVAGTATTDVASSGLSLVSMVQSEADNLGNGFSSKNASRPNIPSEKSGPGMTTFQSDGDEVNVPVDAAVTGSKRQRSISDDDNEAMAQGTIKRLRGSLSGVGIKEDSRTEETIDTPEVLRRPMTRKPAFLIEQTGRTMRGLFKQPPPLPQQTNVSLTTGKLHVDGPTHGIFDDAEDDMLRGPTSGLGKETKVGKTQLTSEPSSKENSGIFDDADEDDTFDVNLLKVAPPAPNNPPIRSDLVAAILGTPTKPPPTPAYSDLVNSEPDKPTKRRKPTKSIRKVLSAKREQEAAESLFAGKVDLLKILPRPDCQFLGEELWVFTMQQLEFILDDSDEKQHLRRDMLRRVANSTLFQSSTSGGGPRSEPLAVQSKDETPPTGVQEANPETSIDNASSGPIQQPLDGRDRSSATTVSSAGLSDDKTSPEQTASGSLHCESSPFAATSVDSTAVRNSGNSDVTLGSEKDLEVVRSHSQGLFTSGEGKHVDSETGKDESRATSMSMDEAEARVQSWKQKITQWRASNTVAHNMLDRTQFPLDGPMSCLFPACTWNFLQSVNITNALDFMSLKRTETGLIVDMFRSWRSKCGQTDVGGLAVAKHLLGVGARVEASMSTPPADQGTREWMGGLMVVLTGAAKDFLILYSKIYSADDFVNRRTKDLAGQLVEWRDSKGLPKLKGTGKVAMISAWKSLLKEAKDVESADGHVIGGVDFQQEAQGETPKAPFAASVRKPSELSQGIPGKKQLSDVEQALNSPTFLGSIFKENRVSLLASVGIKTAQELLDADKRPNSPLVVAVIGERADTGLQSGSIQPASCVRLVYDWCQRVKSKLDEIEKGEHGRPPEGLTGIGTKVSTAPFKETTTAGANDPYNALSVTSRMFLETIGITSAEGFLAAKTTDIANEFIKYRQQKNMAVLKGLGAVASVSGWKSLVRKAAKDVGQGELVTLNAGRNSGIKLNRKPKEILKSANTLDLGQPTIKETIDHRVLYGRPKRLFWVEGANRLYLFELSVRGTSMHKAKPALFVTYLGCELSMTEAVTVENQVADTSTSQGFFEAAIMKKLSMRSETEAKRRDPFCSAYKGLGAIEISQYGVEPIPRPVEALDPLKREIEAFVRGDSDDPSDIDGDLKYNVFEGTDDLQTRRFFLFLSKPIEKGQTVELHFLPGRPHLDPHYKNDEFRRRHWIQRELSRLSLPELKAILDLLNDTLGASVYQQQQHLFDSNGSNANRKSGPENNIGHFTRTRRRIHWVGMRVFYLLRKEWPRDKICRSDAIMAPLWTNDMAAKLSCHSEWGETVRSAMEEEAKNEILAELSHSRFGQFDTTRSSWCPMANRLFQSTLGTTTRYIAELDSFCSSDKLVSDLCGIVSGEVSRLLSVTSMPMNPTSLEDLSLTFHRGVTHESNAFPSPEELHLFDMNQSYVDAMELCDELAHGAFTGNEVKAVACLDRSADENERTCFKDVSEMEKGGTVALEWYIQRQIVAVVEIVARSGVENIAIKPSVLVDISSCLFDAAKKAMGEYPLTAFPLSRSKVLAPARTGIPPLFEDESRWMTAYQPNSEQFFLSMVWPLIKKVGWKIESGERPSDVTYLPPGAKKDPRIRLLKQQAARQKRATLAKATSALGLGHIPKEAKRLLIACSSASGAARAIGDGMSVSEALNLFFGTMDREVTDNPGSRHRLKGIRTTIESTFDKISPHLSFKEEAKGTETADGLSAGSTMGCEYLMRLLLVMPSMLRQSDLSILQVEDTLGVIRELMTFLVTNHKKCFGVSFHLPFEDYQGKLEFQPFLVPRLSVANLSERTPKPQNDEDLTDDMKEIILPSDRPDLSDFVVFVMSQVIVCRATSADINRKGRRVITLGHPGLMCRHCLGVNGEGKYFFGNIQSLTTASTTIEKHIAKCPKISIELKDELAVVKSRHAEQQKQLPQGSQSAFFSRLWDRLHMSRIAAGAEADMYVTLSATPPRDQALMEEPSQAEPSQHQSFRNYVELVTHLQTAPQWKDNADLQAGFEQYYRFLDWGGRVFNTNAMPPRFSSEWILSRMGQRRDGTRVAQAGNPNGS